MTDTQPQSKRACGETSLVRCARSGDQAAFDILARHYRPLLFALAFLRTSHREEAEDLVQEVLMRAWQNLPALQDPTLFLPWLKTITANVCISWYRRISSRHRRQGDMADESILAPESLPLADLLEKERQRELHAALLTLPTSNRLALLMHIWSGSSYEDIAHCTNVPVTTVEGRIYRAKRQLRRLLHDTESAFQSRSRHCGPLQTNPDITRSEGKQKMTITPPNPIARDLKQPSCLAVFTRRFATMLDAGIPLLHALDILQETPSPYGEVALDLKQQVAQGALLSEAMATHSGLFPAAYVTLIRAGERGSILDETVHRMVKVMMKEWQLACHPPFKEGPVLLMHPATQPLPESWAALSAYQRTVTLILFFETFGVLLQSGVPIVQAMEIVTALLPTSERGGWLTVRQEVLAAAPLAPGMERMGIFPRFAIEMVSLGLETGRLDEVLYRLAEAFEDDIEYQAMAQAT